MRTMSADSLCPFRVRAWALRAGADKLLVLNGQLQGTGLGAGCGLVQTSGHVILMAGPEAGTMVSTSTTGGHHGASQPLSSAAQRQAQAASSDRLRSARRLRNSHHAVARLERPPPFPMPPMCIAAGIYDAVRQSAGDGRSAQYDSPALQNGTSGRRPLGGPSGGSNGTFTRRVTQARQASMAACRCPACEGPREHCGSRRCEGTWKCARQKQVRPARVHRVLPFRRRECDTRPPARR